MKASDVVKQLQSELPGRTDRFTTNFSVTSVARVGSVVTVVTTTVHGLVTGQFVNINGAKELNPITSLTFAGGIASAVTSGDHDLTVPSRSQVSNMNVYPFNISDVSGADQSEYNVSSNVLSSINRRNFTYAVSGTPVTPATGTPVLEQEGGYNGRFAVTVLDPTTFTYVISTTPLTPAGGTITVASGIRVTAAFSLRMFLRAYTKQSKSEFFLCVVLGDVTASRNRAILSDASQQISKQDDFRIRLIEPFMLYLIAPAVDSLSGRDIRDEMEDIRGDIYRSLLGVVFPTALDCPTWSKTTTLGDRFASESSTDAVYVHEFSFERVVDVTYRDTTGPDSNRAFKDFEQDNTFDFGTGALDAEIDLDEQPL